MRSIQYCFGNLLGLLDLGEHFLGVEQDVVDSVARLNLRVEGRNARVSIRPFLRRGNYLNSKDTEETRISVPLHAWLVRR
jgi:hypothetical protein